MNIGSRSAHAALVLALGALATQTQGCHVSTGGSSSGGRAPTAGQPGQGGGGPVTMPAGPAVAETYHLASNRQTSSALLALPGSAGMQTVKYDVVDGMAVMEGDIMLGQPAQLPFRYAMPMAPVGNTKSAVALANRQYLWPNGEIPYVIDGSATGATSSIQWAVSHLAQTSLRVRPRVASDKDYVVFRGGGGDCSSYLGRIGGAQDVNIGGCARGSIVHELLHAAGFYHEQSRGDRDEHVTIVWDEISPSYRSNFEKRDNRGQDIGAYDYASIMHYSGRAFSTSGRATIVPKDPNAVIGQREGLSDLDKAAIAELYGSPAAPTPTPTPTPTTPTIPIPTPTTPTPTPTPTTPAPTNPTPAPAVASGSFAGSYTSARGNVTCTESQFSVNCQFPGGTLLCAARGGTQLDCAWNGGGQGRAIFQRQTNGVLAGTYGDFFSHDSRGRWDLTPSGAGAPVQTPAPQQPTQTPSTPAAPTTPTTPAAPAGAAIGFAGNYTSTRGTMACNENAQMVTCSFQESGASGRLDCFKEATGLRLSCTWATFLPRPGSGRAEFSRTSTSDKNLTGTWGHFHASSGGGVWNATR